MLILAKIISMIGLGLISWIIGLLPILGVKLGKVKKEQSKKKMILFSAFTCFGGGVILTSCLTHMLPDVNEILAKGLDLKIFPDSGLPVAEIFVIAGFLLIYILEESMVLFLERNNNHHDHKVDETLKDMETIPGAVKAVKEKEEDDHHGGHGHSHLVMPSNDSFQAAARGFLMILALCIHDLFEGMALGVSRRDSSVWFLLLAFASHKWVIAATLGLNWARSALRHTVSILYMTAFCGVSPIGILIGMLITDFAEETPATINTLIVLQGIATGSLLYIVFFEILEKERQKEVPGIIQALFFSGGFIFMVLLGLAESRGSSDEELAANLTEVANATLDALIES